MSKNFAGGSEPPSMGPSNAKCFPNPCGKRLLSGNTPGSTGKSLSCDVGCPDCFIFSFFAS